MDDAIEVLSRFFEAVNRNDLASVAACFDPEIVRIEPQRHATAGTYRGIESVVAHLQQGRGTWAEGSCDPEGFFASGERVVVYLHARVRLKDSDEWIDGRFADGFVVRDGKIVEYHTFWERSTALDWAGIDEVTT
ncbi:MAG: nuclear transport factor 2 family protein [Fimbriimonadaceae bacterium]|nr:nuclear transport factor 2 family protein [Chthonomonadaceae bacterium]MCO5295238.1 nuclear transport factor 2 family protein [Fimbriimonadaceae bacterium]